MSEDIISGSEFKTRLIDLGYKDLSSEELKFNIRQIYMEENGELLKADIKILKSSDIESDFVKDSGYDGIAVHIDTVEKEEVYVISEGTQDLPDWLYNIKAMLAGQTIKQAQATDVFVQEAKKHFNVDDNVEVNGMSHSLAHNNNTIALLSFNTFDNVYSVNGAQLNYYQLFNTDFRFNDAVKNEFSFNNDDEVYNLSPQDLHDFAMTYYKDKADRIDQVISTDDPLYAVSVVRGFFTLGSITMVDTNPDVPGLRELIADIPDNVIKEFQELAIDFAVASNEGGTNEGVKELIGIDVGAFKDKEGMELAGHIIANYDTMVRALNEKLPPLLDRVQTVTANSNEIFGSLEEAGYITERQKEVTIDHLTRIEKSLIDIENILKDNVNLRDKLNNPFLGAGNEIVTILRLASNLVEIYMSYMEIEKTGILKRLESIKDSHGLQEMLSSMSDGLKSYIGADMIYTSTSTKGEPIKVNISAALRMYQKSIPILEAKSTKISNFEKAIKDELDESYKDEKRKVQDEINQMESSPSSYRFLLSKHGYYPTFNKEIKSIRIHEIFYPLENNDFEEHLEELKKSVESGKLYIEKYRNAIEDLFEEEENVSQLFDLSRRI
ncbi:DUF6792 domain-containing protein [Terribacillus saccharophilus]|uniref:DUF6792 domain-containing protein n=1 Tax=Terribacillus saccharophilus TaxID=361277 RepID=A0ABX4GZ22_9BACI|nr:DUF6792 domain-containing protein [Terribacillus saccharophilus]PAD35498.1 hypothetical protein CHH56_08535 [Terribacillus saccharophilus]PAD96541.1 hypothetical protein CHH50_08025 [Terribacillus saccharophilus]PAE00117.1 hypothetical protein CHH48_08930 [Terribacillus saccharophilus]